MVRIGGRRPEFPPLSRGSARRNARRWRTGTGGADNIRRGGGQKCCVPDPISRGDTIDPNFTLKRSMLTRMNPHTTKRSRYRLMLGVTCLAALSAGTVPASAQSSLLGEDILNYFASLDQWPMFGQNPMNTANNLDFAISKASVGKLAPKWTFKTGGDVSARAAIVRGVAYFPDWATPATSSNLWAVDANSGKQIWKHTLSDYGLPTPTHSRTTPAVVGGVLYLGTQEGAWLLAIDAQKGNLIWKTELETVDPYAIITTSPVVASGLVFTGIASTQEGVLR